jgi:3-dehydroquinate dehydratase-2
MKKIIIINGPNLNLLGKREPETYGNKSFNSYMKELVAEFPEIELTSFQTNVEGEIIDKIQETGFSLDGIVLNAGGYTHTSVSIADAIAAIKIPVIEVHISNVYAREEYRHHSLMAKNCKGVIAGFGLDSYKMAITSF